MKKRTLILIALLGVICAHAQNINPGSDYNTSRYNGGPVKEFKADSLLSRWCLDINVTGGALWQHILADNPESHYLNAQNGRSSDLQFTKGSSFGIDAEIAYFFDEHRNWGIGAGLLYMHQNGTVGLDNFHVEYQSVDYAGNIFRQVVTASNPIHETIGIDNLNIPLMLKYKNRFSRSVGFTADAGVFINVTETNAYNTDASFDYEAIYKFTGAQGASATVYETSSVPASTDLLITKAQYVSTHPASSVDNYFNTLRSQGNNVGLGVRPNNNTGTVSYKSGSGGLLLRPAVSFSVSDQVALNLGLYYVYQKFQHTATGTYRITDKVGEYNSVLNTVSSVSSNSFGISFGIRLFLTKAKEKTMPAMEPEEEKMVEVTPEPAAPEDTVDVTPVVDISTPILFDVNRTVIRRESYPVLEEAVIQINENKDAHLVVHGYADNTGGVLYNKTLSKKRAVAVKNYLRNKGVKPKLIRTVGHGSKSPVASNATPEGRARNRRAVIKLKHENVSKY